MIRLMKFFSLRSWIAVFLIIGLTIFQVYCTMTLTDYVSGIIAAITYLHYHNVPSSIPSVGPMIAQMLEAGGWESVLTAAQAMVEGGSMSPEAYSLMDTTSLSASGSRSIG